MGLSEEELLCKNANQQDSCKTISSTMVQESKAPTVRRPHKDINNAASPEETARVISEAAVEVNTIQQAPLSPSGLKATTTDTTYFDIHADKIVQLANTSDYKRAETDTQISNNSQSES